MFIPTELLLFTFRTILLGLLKTKQSSYVRKPHKYLLLTASGNTVDNQQLMKTVDIFSVGDMDILISGADTNQITGKIMKLAYLTRLFENFFLN